MPERLANRLKECRNALDLTQAQLAERVGVTRKTVNVIEAGNYFPSVFLALKIAGALNVTVDEIFQIKSEE